MKKTSLKKKGSIVGNEKVFVEKLGLVLKLDKYLAADQGLDESIENVWN